MNYQTHTFANGIRLIHRQVPNMVAHFGILMNTGSRDEKPAQHGMAHLVEHMLFKGTKKRKAYHILSRMEDAGGEINAYTTKEETAVYTSFMKEDYERSIELLSDILNNSVFPENELLKEKEVIIDEINSYLDNPSEQIFDDFEEKLFHAQAIGRNILGTSASLGKTNRKGLTDFFQQNYHTDEMVLSSVGDISFPLLIRLVEKYFGKVPGKSRPENRIAITETTPFANKVEKNTYQAHFIIGNLAYPLLDERRIPLHLLNNILGGPGLNTRLNMTLREKNGLSYHAESHYNPYSDTGVFCVYFSSEKQKMDKSLNVVLQEFKKLREKKLGSLQLHKAKKQLLGQIAIAAENHENLLLTMAKSLLVFNRFDSMEEIAAKIEMISDSQLLGIANEIFREEHLSHLIFI